MDHLALRERHGLRQQHILGDNRQIVLRNERTLSIPYTNNFCKGVQRLLMHAERMTLRFLLLNLQLRAKIQTYINIQ